MTGNDFFVNGLTRAYSGFLQSQLAGTKTKGTMGFMDTVEALDESGNVGALSTEDMTLEEYKQYIYQKISLLPMHPSQAMSSVSIHITDKGFEAMKKNPSYEKWVLDTLKANFAFNDPWADICGGSFSVYRFGETKEEYRGDSWRMGFQGGKGSSIFDEESEESFWEKRAKRHRKYMEMLNKEALEEKIMGRVLMEAAVRRGDYEGMFAEQSMAQSISFARLLLNPELTES